MGSSRPASIAIMAAANRPTLQDILSNSAPPPWTLGAFMAYLSQNHCLETLEFTMEAERYQNTFAQIQMDEGQINAALWPQDAQDYTFSMWRKLIGNYIMPCGPREVNLPGRVRDRLLRLDRSSTPPNPAELEEAVKIVYELMNDSVLLSFFDSMQQQEQYYYQQPMFEVDEQQYDARQGRSRLRMPKESSSSGSGNESSRSPKPSFLPQLGLGRHSEGRSRSPSASSAEASMASDHMGFSDASGASTPPAGEPITPPTTPPTSDWNFGTSPNGLQRAITVHNASWKRMSQKLGLGGLKSKSRSSRRPNNTSSGSNNCAESSSSGEGNMYMDSEHYGQPL